MKLGIFIAVLVLGTFGGVRAATIELTDGRVFDGEFLGGNEYSYFIMADGLRYELPRSKVAWLSSTHANVQASLISLNESTETACAGCDATTKKAAQANTNATTEKTEPAAQLVAVTQEERPVFVAPLPSFRLPIPDNPRQTKFLREAVQELSDESDLGLRPQAIESLREAGAHGLAILVEDGLYNMDPSIRTQSVQILGTLGQRNVLRYLIEAFQAVASEHIPADQVNYIDELTDWISVMTDQDFYIRVRGGAPDVAEDMADWWNRNWMNVPRQLGEPQIDPNAPDYMAQLKELRRLNQTPRESGPTPAPTSAR